MALGVMVKVTVADAFVGLLKVPLILPEPPAAMPGTVAILSLVQVYVVPTTAPVSIMGTIGPAKHKACDDGEAITSGMGLTVIVPDAAVTLGSQAIATV